MSMSAARTKWDWDRLTVAPGVYDPFSARLAATQGFRALYLGGNALGLQLGVGQPFVTLTETVAAAQAIRRVSDASLIVDAGAGFGDAAHARVAMQALARAGAAAIHIDDQLYPKRAHYHVGKGRLAATRSVAEKLRAMRSTQGAEDVLLIARTDAWRLTRSLEETLERAGAYLEAGADALMVLDLKPEETEPFRVGLPAAPLVWIGGIAEPVPERRDLVAAGFSIAVYPFVCIGTVYAALQRSLAALKDTGRPKPLDRPFGAAAREALSVVGFDDLLSIEADTTERD